jgi:hypothetical protein
MQPGPGRNTGTGWSGKKKANPGMKPVVDPRPGTGRKVPLPVVDPRPTTGRKVPNPGLGTDDKIYRTMPITEKQLKGIKKMYGIK